MALVRQMQLIDDQGKRVTTNVTESLRMREGPFEMKLNRRAFLAGKPSLKAIGADDLERDELLLMGANIGPGPSKVLATCARCHDKVGGINSVFSAQRFRPLPRTPAVKPELFAAKREDVEMSSWAWTANRYEWGLLQGLIQNGPRD